MIYHTGGSVWLIDGETDPHAIRGYNEEDDFGFGWAYHPFPGRWPGCAHVVDPGTHASEFSAYRFYGPDPIPFTLSLIAYSGSRADDTESVLYYYKTLDSRSLPVETPKQWQVVGPFRCHSFEEFKNEVPPESAADWPGSWHHDGRTLPTLSVPSRRSWVDLTWEYRGRRPLWNDYAEAFAEKTLSLLCDKPVAVSAIARGKLRSTGRREASLRVGFDDWLTLWVNGEEIATRKHDRGFETASFPAVLQSGENTIQIKLSNFDNQEYRLWAFSCAVEGESEAPRIDADE